MAWWPLVASDGLDLARGAGLLGAMGEPVTEPSLAHTGFADQHDLRRGVGDARRPGLAQEAIGVKVPKVDDSVVVHPFVRPGRSQQGPARMERKTWRPRALAGLSDHACRGSRPHSPTAGPSRRGLSKPAAARPPGTRHS